jgi:UDP-N-acetylmuramate--alanine ligase
MSHRPAETQAPDLRSLARAGAVHFMGIGGAGMCALAELVLRAGGQVTGCDLRPGPVTSALEELGARVYADHDPTHVAEASALVMSAAVPSEHPEVMAARERGIPVLKRAEALGAVVNQATVVGIAGTHGKTSSTAMTVEVLAAAGLNPTGLVGGRAEGWAGNLRPGGSDLYVVEADEYDRSFLSLSPDVVLVTSLEADHLDTYGDLQGVEAAFGDFVERVPAGGRVAVCGDDHGASRLLVGLNGRGYSYGLHAGAQLRAMELEYSPEGTRFEVLEEGVSRGPVTLGVPGLHNVRNALGAAAVARHLGAGWDEIRKGLGAYRGVVRRFQRLGEPGGVVVIDDYAHHPTEIRATLHAVSRAYPGRRIVAAYQPHLYSRTRDFAREFGVALARADVVWVTDVYPAREAPIAGVTGELVAVASREAGAGDVHYHPALDGLADALVRDLRPGDVCVVMGAGSIETVAPEVVERLVDGE